MNIQFEQIPMLPNAKYLHFSVLLEGRRVATAITRKNLCFFFEWEEKILHSDILVLQEKFAKFLNDFEVQNEQFN